jgi:hypothetical protein
MRERGWLRDIIGDEGLDILSQTCGGLVIQIPKTQPRNGPLLDLPELVMLRLIKYAGGTEVYVPRRVVRRNRAVRDAIRQAYDAGESVRSIARRYGYSARWVYQILGSAD